MSAPVVACIKWVTSRDHDDRYGGMSPADEAALEWALRHGAAIGAPVRVITVGPDGAEAILRAALACGAADALHIVAPNAPSSQAVAAAIAEHARDARTIWCGDLSADRGTGSVPAYLAAITGRQQALGAIGITLDTVAVDGVAGDDVAVEVLRRLDGGRRERLRVGHHAVISVEGATAALRRAGLRAALGARSHTIERVMLGGHSTRDTPRCSTSSYRPRARALAGPSGDDALARIRSIIRPQGASTRRAEVVTLTPDAAAARIVDALRAWEYLDAAHADG